MKSLLKEKLDKKPPNIPMTGPLINDVKLVFPRKFRWLLKSIKHPNIHYWMKSVNANFVNKSLTIVAYDEPTGCIFSWLQDLKGSDLILTHFDGCGGPISSLTFSNLNLVLHESAYDYDSNDVLTHNIVITYKKVERKNDLHIN